MNWRNARWNQLLRLGLAAWTVGGAPSPAQDQTAHWRPALMVQTGFASTFQLTLGGTFGKGPAWQNRAVLEFAEAFRPGDAVVITYWTTMDARSLSRDWIGGVSYKVKGWSRGRQSWSGSFGYQRWLFPSVLTGANDHLAAVNSVYRTKWKYPISVTADDWAAVSSPLGRGNLVHVQAAMAHPLWEGRGLKLVARHGPSSTYSWNFYRRPGWRVIRYGGGLTLESGRWSVEGALRQQSGIAPRVPDNTYWSVLLTRRW